MVNKIQLKQLLIKYKKELSCGNKQHIKDIISIMVISDLARGYTLDSIAYEINGSKITLNDLIVGLPGFGFIHIDEYVVPEVKELINMRRRYKIENFGSLDPNNYQLAATRWLEMMIKFGFIKEGQTIVPSDYVLNDFVTDVMDIKLNTHSLPANSSITDDTIIEPKHCISSNVKSYSIRK